MNINLFHIIIVSGLFLYVGVNHNTPKILYSLLFVLGILIILYHIFKISKYIKEGKRIWINLIHILLFAPLIMYIGYNGENTPRMYFEILLMLGFSSIGYHTYLFTK